MQVQIRRATVADAAEIHRAEVAAFRELYRRYRDAASPAIRTVGEIAARFEVAEIDHWLFELRGEVIGAVRVVRQAENVCYLSSLCVVPEYQALGVGRLMMEELEGKYPKADRWTLQTIKQEERLCRFYEKLGYTRMEKPEKDLQPGMSLVWYEKVLREKVVREAKEKSLRQRIFEENGGVVFSVLLGVVLLLAIYLTMSMFIGAEPLRITTTTAQPSESNGEYVYTTTYEEKYPYTPHIIVMVLVLIGMGVHEVYLVRQAWKCDVRSMTGVMTAARTAYSSVYYRLRRYNTPYYLITVEDTDGWEHELKMSLGLWNARRVDLLVRREVTVIVVGENTVVDLCAVE